MEHGKRTGQNEKQRVKLKTDAEDRSIKPIEIKRQCYHIDCSEEKILTLKTQNPKRLKTGKSCYCLGVQWVPVKNGNLSKRKRLVDC